MDSKGLAPGHEQWEGYVSAFTHNELVQYDYRSRSGYLFSVIAPTIVEARRERDAWLHRMGEDA